ncbi:hypothetical protein BC567DRAFT_233656 [Phyllosticta citribraziliensis]
MQAASQAGEISDQSHGGRVCGWRCIVGPVCCCRRRRNLGMAVDLNFALRWWYWAAL